ncbi:MAG TPA: hypothetical protein VE868_07740 [Balneolaceae bacterium]|nr:hypothetical protein [Balneolaceae bacterium]
MGINTSVTAGGETLKGTIKALNYTGIRWIRIGPNNGNTTKEIITLHNRTGAKVDYGLLSGYTNITALVDTAKILAQHGALLAIEGNNEPNNFGIAYRGKKGGNGSSWLPVAKVQRNLYRTVKNDSVLHRYPVWNISESGAEHPNVGLQFLTIPKTAQTKMPAGTRYADYANCHNYITHPSWPGLHDNQTWRSASPDSLCPVDGLYGNYGRTWRNHYEGYRQSRLQTLPRVTTETGYPTGDKVTEKIQGRLYLDLYLSQFKRGWSYTAIYLLRIRNYEISTDKPFAIFNNNYTPKLPARYLHNFTTILADKKPVSSPGRLNFSIPDKPKTVHDLLLQKSNRKFYLVVWGEKFKGGSENITLHMEKRHHSMKIYDPTVGTSPVRSVGHTHSIHLTMNDHPIVIEIG